MMKKLPTAKNAELAQIFNRGFVPGAYLYVKKTAKKKHLFCYIFLNVKYWKKMLDLFKKKKFGKIIKKI